MAHTYEDIISVENLLGAWKEFRKGKRSKLDVLEFQSGLRYQCTALHTELKSKTYRHGGYHHFRIADPKPRDIHKASVRDRLLHHAIYRQLYPFFDTTFAYQVSRNHTRTAWVLKCDIKKFFASIDHQTLFAILGRYIPDHRVLRTSTKRRMLRRLAERKGDNDVRQSYLGMLRHGNVEKLCQEIKKSLW